MAWLKISTCTKFFIVFLRLCRYLFSLLRLVSVFISNSFLVNFVIHVHVISAVVRI